MDEMERPHLPAEIAPRPVDDDNLRYYERRLTMRGDFHYHGLYPSETLFDTLEKYQPGATDRVLRMIERAQTDEQELDKLDIKEHYALEKARDANDRSLARSGQFTLFGIFGLFCATAVGFAYFKYPGWGMLAFGVSAALFVMAFLWGRLPNVNASRDQLTISNDEEPLPIPPSVEGEA